MKRRDDDNDNDRARPGDVLIGAVFMLAMVALAYLDDDPAPVGAGLLMLILFCLLDP
jgi:hypothetical protein